MLLSYSVDQLHEFVQEQGRIYLNYIYNLHPIFAISLQSVHDNYWVCWYVLFVFFCQTHKRLRSRTRMGQKKLKQVSLVHHAWERTVS